MNKKIENLLETIDETVKKCAWIKNQSSIDIISSITEETSEVKDALEKNDVNNLEEEIGDLLFTVILLGKISENKYNISFEKSIERVTDKIIKRSPHVFGDQIALTSEEAANIWNSIKYNEYK